MGGVVMPEKIEVEWTLIEEEEVKSDVYTE